MLCMLTAMTACIGDGTHFCLRYSATSRLRLAALDSAKSKLNQPYFWGGKGPYIFDCSGLITWAYRTADSLILLETQEGFSKVAAVNDLYALNILTTDRYRVRRGDIIFITSDSNKSRVPISHCGLFVTWIDSDKFSFINASSHYVKVVTDTFSIFR